MSELNLIHIQKYNVNVQTLEMTMKYLHIFIITSHASEKYFQ